MTPRKPVAIKLPTRPLSQGEVRAYVEEGLCPFCGRGPYLMLAGHTQMCHGVDKRDLRELLGVTWTTSISPQMTEQRSASMVLLREEGRVTDGHGHNRGMKYQYSRAGLDKQKATLVAMKRRQAAEKQERLRRGEQLRSCAICRRTFDPGSSKRATCSHECRVAMCAQTREARRQDEG